MQGRLADADGALRYVVTRLSYEPGESVAVSVEGPPTRPLAPLNDYDQKVLRARRRGTIYPYELVGLLTGPRGEFTELDLRGGELVKCGRCQKPRGYNTTGIVAGLVSTPTPLHPEGIRRVVLFGDPTKALGALARTSECARIIAALDLAEREGLPVGMVCPFVRCALHLSMDSGTENMDWIARVLRRIVEFTQANGEVNIVVTGINVGAQPYWNAEATMLMHTKEHSRHDSRPRRWSSPASRHWTFPGGVSAEDNFGIGGVTRG